MPPQKTNVVYIKKAPRLSPAGYTSATLSTSNGLRDSWVLLEHTMRAKSIAFALLNQ